MLRRNPKKTKRDILPTCSICGLWAHFCVCEILPQVQSKIGITLIQHSSELLRQSNTGRLTRKMIDPCEILHWGSQETPFQNHSLKVPGVSHLVLYPRASSRVLKPGDFKGPRGENRNLVLLDATWAQAKSMSRRIPEIQDFTFVSLPQTSAPSWKLRKSPGRGHCCTLEAAIRALSVIEGKERVRPLEMALELVNARALHMRGKLTKVEMEKTCRPITDSLQPSKAAPTTDES